MAVVKAPHKAQAILLAHNNFLQALSQVEIELPGNTKMDGPHYIPDVLQDVYAAAFSEYDVKVATSISSINATPVYFIYSCYVSVRVESENNGVRGFSERVDFYVERDSITLIDDNKEDANDSANSKDD